MCISIYSNLWYPTCSQDVKLVRTPSPIPRPYAIEESTPDGFTVAQLRKLQEQVSIMVNPNKLMRMHHSMLLSCVFIWYASKRLVADCLILPYHLINSCFSYIICDIALQLFNFNRTNLFSFAQYVVMCHMTNCGLLSDCDIFTNYCELSLDKLWLSHDRFVREVIITR